MTCMQNSSVGRKRKRQPHKLTRGRRTTLRVNMQAGDRTVQALADGEGAVLPPLQRCLTMGKMTRGQGESVVGCLGFVMRRDEVVANGGSRTSAVDTIATRNSGEKASPPVVMRTGAEAVS